MHPNRYCLTWHSYSDHLRDMMKVLMINDDFADVTLVSEDKKYIKAHKNILSACSPVLRDIVKLEQSPKTIIFLRGINFSELESIIQFIYLGEATIHEERINEFLAVARSLELKEIFNAKLKTETNEKKKLSSDPVTDKLKTETVTDKLITGTNDKFDTFGKQTMRSSHSISQVQNYNHKEEGEVNSKYDCDKCDRTYSNLGNLSKHKRSAHEGVKYACDQCDYQATQQCSLNTHIESIHEGLRYACPQCDYQATRQDHLKRHVDTKHKGVSFACDHCSYQATIHSDLKKHIKSKHENVKYACDQCDYKASWQGQIQTHIRSKH